MAENIQLSSVITALQILLGVGVVYVVVRALLESLVDRDKLKTNLQRAGRAVAFAVFSLLLTGLIQLFLSYYS